MTHRRTRVAAALLAGAAALGPLAVAGCGADSGEQPSRAQAGRLHPVENPWVNSAYQPGLLMEVLADGRVSIEPAEYVEQPDRATFVLAPLDSPAPATYPVAADAQLYISALWSRGQDDASGNDFLPVTYRGLSDFLRSLRQATPGFSPEVWYTLNDAGELTLLFQVYHP